MLDDMLCVEFDIAEPAHASCTQYLAVYSYIVCLSEVVSMTTWLPYLVVIATIQHVCFRLVCLG